MTGVCAAHPIQVAARADERARAVEAVIAQDGDSWAILIVAAQVGVTEETIRRWLRACRARKRRKRSAFRARTPLPRC